MTDAKAVSIASVSTGYPDLDLLVPRLEAIPTLDADALPRVISQLRAAGYSFVTLSALGV